ncbi:MAG: hypothetical protein ACN6N1_08555, partial [Acinetobacter guillouiae]
FIKSYLSHTDTCYKNASLKRDRRNTRNYVILIKHRNHGAEMAVKKDHLLIFKSGIAKFASGHDLMPQM